MYTKSNTIGYKQVLKGVMLKALVYGEKTLMASITLEKGAVIPTHMHLHEQTGFLISGRLDFEINGDHIIAEPGDSWNFLADVLHGVEALDASSIIEVFSPVREDYLP